MRREVVNYKTVKSRKKLGHKHEMDKQFLIIKQLGKELSI